VRVLIVEDEGALASAIERGLRREGMAVDIALDGTEALDKAAGTPYDVVVLDRDLPGVHGDTVCRALIQQAHPPRILMLTAAGGLDERVSGLTLGADDYVPKPFAFEELVARIRALGRRPSLRITPVMTRHDLVMDIARRTVTRGDRLIPLTTKEFAVLEVLLQADGAVVSAEDLLERAWDEHADPFTHTVRVTVSTLRRKLGEPALIETVIGAGYVLP
jgi:DNA-binding response OmpR family regulator